MSAAKQAILKRLRQRPFEAQKNHQPAFVPVTYRTQAERLNHFKQSFLAAHGEVIETKAKHLDISLRQLLQAKQVEKLMLGQDQSMIELLQKVMANGEEPLNQLEIRIFKEAFEGHKAELFHRIDAAITPCFAAIAETGSLVLWPDASAPRSLSLVPPLHIAILKQSQMQDNLAQLFELVEEQHGGNLPSNLVIISGPSKTADIQQTLAYGAHGPCELVVLLVTDQ